MYLSHFGLSEAPFSITPDPGFIFLSGRHREALAHLLYGVGQGGSGGFVQLTGEVGTGKTTLCRALLEQVPEGTRIALVLNPLMNPVEMLAAICEELAIDTEGAVGSAKLLVDRLNEYLLAAYETGDRVVLVIDEAQNLSPEALEQVRLLTNLETSKQKLLQIILLGQPELRDLLQRQSLRQLAQRITARYHLTPLNAGETQQYLAHRMLVAGAAKNPFTPAAAKALYERSQGVPRLINIIADRSLAAAYAAERQRIDARMVHAAADEVQLGEPRVRRLSKRWRASAAALLLMAGGALAWYAWQERDAASAALSTARSTPVPALEMPQAEPSGQPAPQPLEPVQPEVLTLDRSWLETQDLRAFQGLADAWQRGDDAALLESSCLGQEGLGFACVRDQGSWQRIVQLGLPVVLVLPGASPYHVFLSGVQDERVQIGSGAAAAWIERAALEPRWFGEFFVAWPQDQDWPQEIRRGDRGGPVVRVLDLATRADPPYEGEAVFGADFEQWLMRFQTRNGLHADGIVGPKTLLYLMRYSIQEPRLKMAQETGS